ncbi:hypothetical protein SAMN02745166_01099 [Prosthecobacter debontii]|uniref:Large polyvalent protein associated domain-containing protein n=1 Tax=Prosthecobacter debontii TaxID=48467 RepID=A0A1T4X658_9BACT|nr:hypothetical protein [Prosthecobacter debontii]SKA85104.1 hypothetical protein SAMN02745166_01099 [Prosthecobacter debontii]
MADWSDFPVVPSSGWDAFPIVAPADTGQGYVSSLVNSAGRGFARVAADIPGGLGYLTGSDDLVQWGDDIEAGINEALPVNPIYQDDFAMKAAGAVGQAGSMFATAGIGGAIGKGLGAVRVGAEVAGLGSGFLAGARGGGQEAEQYGLEGAAAYGRVLAGGTIELATEKLLFGMGTETRAVQSMLGETIESGWGRFFKDVATEGGEEGIAEISNNAATALLAPSGTQTPGLFEGGLEASLLGMVGGGVFGGVNALAGSGQAEAPVTVESGTIPFSAAPGAQALVPGPTARTEIAGQPFYFDGLQWNKLTDPTKVSASPELEPPFVPLNPANPIEGTLIVELENRRKAAMRQGQIQTPGETSEGTPSPPRGTPAPVETGIPPTSEVDISTDNSGIEASRFLPPPGLAAAGETAKTLRHLPGMEPAAEVAAEDTSVTDPDEAAADAAMDAKVDREDDILNTYSEEDLSTWPLPQAMRDRAQAALDVLEEAGYDLEQLAAAVADPKLNQGVQQAARELMELRKRADARWGVAHEFMKSRSARYILGIDKSVAENQNTDDEPADSTFNSFRFTPVEDGALAEREREVLDRVRRSEGNPAISAAAGSLLDRGREQGTATATWIGALKEVFGKDVLFVHPGKGSRTISFEGASVPGHRNTIVLDATSKSPVLYLTGHELTHALKEQHPELWKKLRDELLAMASDWSDYRGRLRKRYQEDQIEDEFLGDVVGGQFRERAFWEKLEQRNPSLFRRLASAALQFLNRILGKVGGLSRDVRGYFADIEAARDVIADVLEQYAAARRFPDRTLIESDDADLATVDAVKKPSSPMELTSMRMSEASQAMRKMLKPHKASRDERTVDGNPIEEAGYLVRRDADMEAAADQWLDSFAESQALQSRSHTETRALLNEILDDIDVDVAAILLTRLIDGRGREFGYDTAEVQALGQKNASRAGFALLEWKKTLDPLDKLVDQAAAKTGATMGKELGLDTPKEGDPADVPAQLNQQLQQEMQAEAEKALRESLDQMRAQLSDVQRQMASDKQAKAEEIQSLHEQADKLRDELARATDELERAEREATIGEVDSQITELQNQLEATQRDLASSRESTAIFQKVLDLLSKAGSKRKAILSKARKLSDSIIEDALARKRQRRESGMLFSNPLPEFADDVAIGAGIMLKGIVEFAAWTKAMADTIGEITSGSLDSIYLESSRKYSEEMERFAGEEPAPKPSKERVRKEPGEVDPYDAIGKLREQVLSLRKKLAEVEESLGEEKARADQEREVGIAIGYEEGLAQGRAEQPPAPPREIDLFENWLMGERIEGLPSVDTVARRFIQPQRWDGERFRSALGQLFPALDQNILDDAVDRITEQMNNRLAAARRRAISAFTDRLAERNSRLKNDQRFVTFYGHLQKAAEYGILDSQVFADSFASAWSLNGLTPATVLQLRQMYQQITATNANGQPMHFGMVRETMERRFIEAVNRIAPGQAWLNFIFNNYQARVLSSASSILNQFSSVFRILAPVDAISRAYRMGQGTNPSTILAEYWAGVSSLGRNLPLMMTAIRGESLGHLASQVASGHVPTEQQTQHLQPGEAVRVGNTRLGPRLSWLARMAEMWTWRTIRAAEGLTGVADAEAHFRETLTNHYRAQGMTPVAAREQALRDIHASGSEVTAARQQALQEQSIGSIGAGNTVIERRIAEIIQRNIENRLNAPLVARTEQLTGYAQFKTMPTGPIGFAVSQMMASIASPASKAGQVARFWFLFGRFLGHTVDVTLGYTPGAHLLTRSTGDSGSQRNKLIREVFGSEEAYRQMVDSRAVTGSTFFLMTGALMALALSMADDDDEPFFAVTGSGGIGDPSRKDALKATGQWGEMQIRIGGRPVISYGQIPELSPLLSILGNISDHARFGHFLNQRQARDGEQPGKYPADLSTLGLGFGFDWALSPIKRSTYRSWFDALDGMMSIQSAGSADYAGQQLLGLVTRPVDGMLRVPMVVDVDKALRFAEGSLKPDGMLEGLLRRVPFAHVGTEVYNAYGERTPAWDIFSMFPSSPTFSKEAERAARLNVETGTRRSAPKDISLHYTDGSVRELKPNELEQYQRLSGQLYTESLLRNETDIRRAYQQGGQGAASKIVDNISAKANREAKKQLGY